jgi:hypothetical protein
LGYDTPLPLEIIDQELIGRKARGVRQVWVGAGLKERTKGSGFREKGNLCWVLGFSIMGLGFFRFWTMRKKEISAGKIEDDKCMEDGMGKGHAFFFF